MKEHTVSRNEKGHIIPNIINIGKILRYWKDIKRIE
jgi:hypothetical protein